MYQPLFQQTACSSLTSVILPTWEVFNWHLKTLESEEMGQEVITALWLPACVLVCMFSITPLSQLHLNSVEVKKTKSRPKVEAGTFKPEHVLFSTLKENKEGCDGVIVVGVKQSYCYHPEVTYFLL